MRDSILYAAIRALFVSFCVVIGLTLGFIFITMLVGSIGSKSEDEKLTIVHTEEILPNANGKRETLTSSVPVILQINIDGIIGTEDISAKSIRQQLVESREGDFKDNRVKGLILYIDTPGGTVNDANAIYQAIKEYKTKYSVPVYAYIDGLCASGGMYIALAADKIFASDVSLIGSVGVIAPTFMNLTKLLEKLGVETLTISAGKNKDALNPLRPWKPGEENNYRDIVEYYYDHFVDLVTTHRPEITKDLLVKEYGAHIFPAPLALEKGFIDVSGVLLADALRELLVKADITDEQYQFIRLENKGWWKSLFSSQTNMLSGKMEHKFTISPEIDLLFSNQYLYLYTPQ